MKLLAFTLAMVVVPIGGYFLTVHTVFQGMSWPIRPHWTSAHVSGNSSYAGGLAALLANVVLIGYVVVALNEEDPQDKGKGKGKETKKEL